MSASARARRPFLTAHWRDLVMLNYEVELALLEPLVPAGTSLDSWRGRTLVSVVGFRFESTRVLGLRIPRHVDFDEVNLRFYVRRETAGEVRRGVVFVRELVPRAAIAVVAKLAYNEPYRAVAMRSDVREGASGTKRIEYAWRPHSKWEHVAASLAGEPALPPRDSEAAFITEHYWGYTRQRDGRTFEYEVEHPPWRTWNARDAELVADVANLYGAQFEPCLRGQPSSAFVAEGSAVRVFRPRALD